MFDWFWEFVYDLLYAILYLIDFVVDVFRVLAGLTDVSIPDGSDTIETNIVTYFLTSHTILRAFALVASISLVILTIFTVIAVIRKQYLEEREQRSIGAIVGQALKTCLLYVLIPVIMTAASYAVVVIMQQLELATNPLIETIMESSGSVTSDGYSGLSISGTLLYIIGQDCIKEGQATAAADLLKATDMELLKYDAVKSIFTIKNLNWFLGFVAGIAIFILFIKSLFVFVERLFNIVGLYVISPLVASSAVLDGGTRFKSWRDSILSQFIVAFSVIIGMNIYFLIIPIVVTIDFNQGDFGNWLIKLFFMVGGAFAVNKLLSVFGNLVNQGAGTEAQGSSDAFGRGLANGVRTTGRILGKAGELAGKGWNSLKSYTGMTTPLDRLKNRGENIRKAKAETRDNVAANKWKNNFYEKHPEAKEESPMDKLNATASRIADKLGAGEPKQEESNTNPDNDGDDTSEETRKKLTTTGDDNPYGEIPQSGPGTKPKKKSETPAKKKK